VIVQVGAREGEFACKLGNEGVLAQELTSRLEAGKAYRFSAWVRVTVPGTSTDWGAPSLRGSTFPSLGTNDLGEAVAENSTDSDYHELSFTRTFSDEETADRVVVGVVNFGFDGECLVDDLVATPAK
jgi:hypothetical protein